MKKIISLFYVVATLVFFAGVSNAQVSTNGSSGLLASYPDLATAITALNGATIVAPVVISVDVANPQTAPVGGYSITATGTAVNTITFTGNNNTITANAGLVAGSLNDAIFKIIGGDYITIQGFAMQENPLNLTTAVATNNMTEFGVCLLYTTLTDGAQNNTIQNNTISLNRTYVNTFAIYSNTRHAPNTIANGTTVTAEVTSAAGANSFNKIYGNTISNVNFGIVFIGAGTTLAAIDNGNDIGGSSALTGNTFTNWGNGAATAATFTSLTTNNYCIFENQQINENVSYNNITSAALTSAVTEGGILKNYSVATPVSGTITATLNNNTVTITQNPSAAATGGIVGITTQGLTTFLSTATFSMNNNTVQNCVLGGSTSTTNGISCIFNTSLPGTMNMNNNNVINNSITATTATTGLVNGVSNSGAAGTVNITGNVVRGFASTSTSGQIQGCTNSGIVVTALNITNNSFGNGSGGFFTTSTVTSGGLFGVSSSAGAATCTTTISGNDIRGITYNTACSAPQTYFTNTGVVAALVFNNNTFTNLNINTTGSVTFFSMTYTANVATMTKTVTNNSIVTAFNRPSASGALLGLTDNGSSVTGVLTTVTGNNFSNITIAGTSTFTGINLTDGGTAPSKTVTGNTFNNITAVSGTIQGFNITYINGTSNISNNTVTNITSTGVITGMNIGSSVSTGTTTNISGNIINNLNSITTGGNVQGIVCNNISTGINISQNTINTLATIGASVVNGISITGSTATNVFRNKIYDLSGSNASSTVIGINVSAGTTNTVYNNIVGDLRTPNANAANPLIGINIVGGTNANVYNNTVRMSATSVGALFGSSALLASTSVNLDMRNNLLFNNSTANTTGFTVAYRRTTTTLTSYGNNSNNNALYAGTPGASNLLFYDGTNSDQTLSSYKARVTPRDGGAVTENVNFKSTAGSSADFLKIDSTIATQLESGASVVSSPAITIDYFGINRYPNAGYPNNLSFPATNPDIGANEFGGIILDVNGPSISYTALGNTPVGNAQTLTATITDPSGVPTAGAGLPVLYFKINASAYSGVTGVSIGSNQYTFTFGSGTTTVGDVVSYYIVAQDAVTPTPNPSCSPSGGASGFSVNPPAVSTPPTTPSTYLAAASFAGVVTVGTGGTYANLTGASGFFNAINTGYVSGNIYVSVLSDLVETGTVALNQFNPGYKIQIRPSGTTTTRLIECTSLAANAPMIDLNGADLVTINGADSASNNGQYFRIVNDNATVTATGSVIRYINDARQDSLRNCILESNASNTSFPIVLLSTTTGANGNDSITVDNCLFRASVATNAGHYCSAYTSSGSGAGAQRNSDNVVSNCVFNGLLATSSQAILVGGVGNGDNWTISNNKIFNDLNFTVTHSAINLISTANNNKVSGNSIGGSAIDRSGNFYGTNTTLNPTAIFLTVGTTTATTVDGNTISNFGCSGAGSGSQSFGIQISAGKVNVGSLSGNTIGGGASAWDTLRTGYDNGWITSNSADTVKIENNTIGNFAYYGLSNDRNSGITINSGVSIIRNNTIRDGKSNSTGAAGSSFTLKGILILSTVAGQVIDGNTIYNLQNTNPGAAVYYTAAIHFNVAAGLSTISRNRMYNITSLGTGTGVNAPINAGIYNSSTAILNIYNNQISLTATTLEPQLIGIHNVTTGNVTLLYNSVYISGVCANFAQTSYGYLRASTSNDTVRNNLFFNERTGGANNYCIGVTSATGWNANSANYNCYVPSAANQVGVIGAFTQQTFANWKTNALSDANSVTAVIGADVTAASLFVAPVAGNLNIDPSNVSCWTLEGLATPRTTPQVTSDFGSSSVVRSITVAGGATDIGSDEFTPTGTPPNVTASGAPANNTTTTYSFLGRILGSITWGAGGTVPTGVTFKYYPGINPPNSSGFNVANGYWVITVPDGTGYTYDIVLNYDPAILGTVPADTNVVVAKSEDGGTTYNAYLVYGTGAGQYERNSAQHYITVHGLTNFSLFALGDNNAPLPVELSSFTATTDKRSVELKWTTVTEQNNVGFDIERKLASAQTWTKVGNVAGSGNSSTPKSYNFIENNLQTGKYNYRLKQIDNNGNYNYHELSSLVDVGIPTKFDLSQNYPNPFNPTTKINYDLPFDSKVSIKLFDMTGREVALIVNAAQSAGYYTVQFNGSNLASGVYFYNIIAEGGTASKFITTKKMVLVK